MFEKKTYKEKHSIFEIFGINREKRIKMSEILSVGSMPVRDDNIIKQQYHAYSPYTTSYENNDEIRIAIQSQDLYVLPSESYVVVEVQVKRKAGNEHAAVEGKWVAGYDRFLFSEIRYEINNIEVDRNKNPGHVSNLKLSTAMQPVDERIKMLSLAYMNEVMTERLYQFIMPLKLVFGFCDDYRKIILNAKHELILVRNRTNIYAYQAATESFDLKVTKVQWKVPHIQLSDRAKLMMLKYLERQRSITVPYRSWDLYEVPQLPETSRHIWTVKSTSQIRKPRFVLFTLQTDKLKVNQNAATLSHCNISDVKLFLNSECYPYENYNLNFGEYNAEEAYLALLNIHKSYYNQSADNPVSYSYATFCTSPIFAFDCSRADESLLNGVVDVRLEINARANIPENTAAFCIIIYENQFEYSPFTGIVNKIM